MSIKENGSLQNKRKGRKTFYILFQMINGLLCAKETFFSSKNVFFKMNNTFFSSNFLFILTLAVMIFIYNIRSRMNFPVQSHFLSKYLKTTYFNLNSKYQLTRNSAHIWFKECKYIITLYTSRICIQQVANKLDITKKIKEL